MPASPHCEGLEPFSGSQDGSHTIEGEAEPIAIRQPHPERCEQMLEQLVDSWPILVDGPSTPGASKQPLATASEAPTNANVMRLSRLHLVSAFAITKLK